MCRLWELVDWEQSLFSLLSHSTSRAHLRGDLGGTLYNGLYGEAPPERGHLFQVLGIWKGRDFTSWGTCKGKEIWYSVYKGLKGQLKGMPLSKQGIWKGDHLSVEGLGKGYLFCQKWYIKGQWVKTLHGASPYKTKLGSLPSPPPPEMGEAKAQRTSQN